MNSLTFRERLKAYYCLALRVLFDLSYSTFVRKSAFHSRIIWLITAKFMGGWKIGRYNFVRLYFFCANQYVHTKFFPKKKEIREVLGLIDIDYFSNILDEDFALKRTIILRKYCDNRNCKGILLIKFTETFSFFLYKANINDLLDKYYLVLEPSWSGYCTPDILYWSIYGGNNIIVHAPEEKDFNFLKSIDTILSPIPIGASNYVDYRVFRPLDIYEKKYDIIYIALFGKYKRHHVLFKHLKKIKNKDISLVLVGSTWKGSVNEIILLAKHYGVFNQIKIITDISHEQINNLLNSCKANVLISNREGANKSIFEGFFANTPAIILENNVGLNKKYINKRTGKIVKEENLHVALANIVEEYIGFDPRAWAMDNITPEKAVMCLREELCKCNPGLDSKCNDEIAVKINSPELKYMDSNNSYLLGRLNLQDFLWTNAKES